MISWLIRGVMFMAGVITAWFVAREAGNFGLVQAAVSFLLILAILALGAFWPSWDAWSRDRRLQRAKRV
jgi:hypothetical protein